MGANTRDAPDLTGLILARRRRRLGTVDLLVKSDPGDAAPAVFGDLYFDTPAAGGNYVLTAQGGTYTVAGGAAVIKRDRNLTASGGSYAVTGASAIVEKDRRLTASGGSYAVAGGQAVIERDRRLTATGGAYTLTGGQAVITYTPSAVNYTLTALGGTYLLAGSTAVLAKQYKLTASGGQYGVAPTNLLLRSEEFDNAAWIKASTTVTPNVVTAPNGTLTADKIVEVAATANHHISRNYATSAENYTFSIYAKAAERSRIILAATTDTFGCGFDLAAGTVVSQNYTASTGAGAITSVGDGWYRCAMTWPSAGASNSMRVLVFNGANSYTGDGTSGIYAWGAQLEVGSTVGGYTQTTTAAKTLPTANITRNRNLTAQGGAYSLAGGAATITTTTSTNAYVLTALGGSYAVTGGDAAITLTPAQAPRNAGFEMVGRKVYIKRGKRIHIFNTIEDADEWADAEQAALDAIAKAQKPTRNAKKRAVRKVNASIEHETINLVELDRLVQHFGIPVELPTLEAKRDWLEVARIALLAREMQDEEDVEMLLFA